MDWIRQNLGTIVVSVVLAIVVALVILKMLRDRKNGKSSCSCGCGGCAMKDTCHKK